MHHSLSPTLHNAAYRAMGLDWVYVALGVEAGRGGDAVEAMRTLGLAGLSVTMPHKAAVAGRVDRLSPAARRLGVVNTVYWSGNDLVGDSTDGPGFMDCLRDLRWSPQGQDCAVFGTGGAARAVVLALATAGARRVTVVGRRPDQAAKCAQLAGSAGSVGQARDALGALLLVNATPIGMPGNSTLPFDLEPGLLHRDHLVVDLVYSPAVTPLMNAAAAKGATAVNGIGMLVHQAARQISVWTGGEAPTDLMAAAALASVKAG